MFPGTESKQEAHRKQEGASLSFFMSILKWPASQGGSWQRPVIHGVPAPASLKEDRRVGLKPKDKKWHT